MMEQDEDMSPSPPESQDASRESPEVHLSTLPAIILLALVWFLLIVPGKIAPLTLFHFGSMRLAGVLGVGGLTIWWILSTRVPRRTRILGYLAVLGITVAGIFFAHGSTHLLMFIYGIPSALSLLVGGLFLFRNQPWRKRGLIGLGMYALFMLVALFVRLINQDAAFGFQMAPRWQPSAEEKFIAEIDSQANRRQDNDLIAFSIEVSKSDWAEFRGPRRDGVATDAHFSSDWDNAAPKQLWRKSVGPAWSSFCIVGEMLFTQEQRDADEAVVAYSATDGSQLWVFSYASRFHVSLGGVGPRATPTLSGGKLYVTGANGRIDCLNPQNGESLWTYDAMEDRKHPIMDWGFAASPLVVAEQVFIINSDGDGRGVIALDAQTGKRNWIAGRGSHTYSSCQLETIDGVPQILAVSNWGLQALDPESGEMIWEHSWDIREMPRVTQPIVQGNTVFLTTGYGNGTQRLDVSMSKSGKWEVAEKWSTHLMKPYFNDAVYHQGNLYGFDGPIMVCLDAETGEKRWKGGRYGHGQVLLLPKMNAMLVLSEKGKLVLLEAIPTKRKELGKLSVLDGVTWNHPVIVGDRLFVRNAQEMACYRLPSQPGNGG